MAAWSTWLWPLLLISFSSWLVWMREKGKLAAGWQTCHLLATVCDCTQTVQVLLPHSGYPQGTSDLQWQGCLSIFQLAASRLQIETMIFFGLQSSSEEQTLVIFAPAPHLTSAPMLADMTASAFQRRVDTDEGECPNHAMYMGTCKDAVHSLPTIYFLPGWALPVEKPNHSPKPPSPTLYLFLIPYQISHQHRTHSIVWDYRQNWYLGRKCFQIWKQKSFWIHCKNDMQSTLCPIIS